MQRREDWPKRLREAIAAQGRFAWGTNDCAMFACSLIEAMTGVDPGASVRGTYSTEAEAQAVIDAHGGSLEAMATDLAEAHGMGRIHPRFAQRGDLILAETTGSDTALGICVGSYAVFAGPTGVTRLPVLPTALLAWRV